MSGVQHILLATDFHPASMRAREVAVEVAWAFGARVSVLHAIPSLPEWPVSLELQRDWAARLLEDERGKLETNQVSIGETVVEIGPAADAILRAASRLDVDLILLGSGDRRGFGSYTAGPVARSVIEQATQPVLAVRPDVTATTFRRILCPIDGSPTSLHALQNAIRLAKAFHGSLRVLTVVPEAGWLSLARSLPAGAWLTREVEDNLAEAHARYQEHWRAEFDGWLTGVDFEGIPWTREIRTGTPDLQIVVAAQELAADLIVMGATGRSGLARAVVGSVARRVLQSLPCSLLTVKQEDLIDEIDERERQTVELLLAEGQALLEARSYEPAARKFNQVLARMPNHIPALEGRAEACEHLGRAASAHRCRQRAEAMRMLART